MTSLLASTPHQSLSTTRQHHAGQRDADWKLAGVDSAQRDTYWKAFNAVVALDCRAPLLTALQSKKARSRRVVMGSVEGAGLQRGRERRTLSKALAF